MGPAILARALGGDVPYAVVIHGSALEYTVKPCPRFLRYAREGLDPARCVLVGSGHTAESLWTTMGDPTLPGRTRLGPPGVDVETFRARTPHAAAAGVRQVVEYLAQLPPTDGGSSFRRDPAATARALDRLRPSQDRLVVFLGKEILAKGLDLLIAAWLLVLQRLPDARLVVAGFGAWHATAMRMTGGLAEGDLKTVRAIAELLPAGPTSPT
jgi:glycosyltransferase involved in cell wall biosynthesis